MDWIDVLDRPVFLRTLFPVAPPLRKVRIFELRLHQDGPRVMLRFDLNDFPAEPPEKWVAAKANTAQVTLGCTGVRDLEIQGWTVDNLADIEMVREAPGRLSLSAVAPGFLLKAHCQVIWTDSVSGYTRSL
ncbi:Imm50 family immunity protein [Melittangium boletus]|uniref:Imm50 family immunity protein n=1 Tax=Melittangium boletus TaxID=83453 RepID=UPI003DA5EAA0